MNMILNMYFMYNVILHQSVNNYYNHKIEEKHMQICLILHKRY